MEHDTVDKLINDYVKKYGKVTNNNYTEAELTNIIALHLTILENLKSVDSEYISWEFRPNDNNEVLYFFKNPENKWELYLIPERGKKILFHEYYDDCHECFTRILVESTAYDSIKDVIETFNNHIKEGFSKEFVNDYKYNMLTPGDEEHMEYDKIGNYFNEVLLPLAKSNMEKKLTL